MKNEDGQSEHTKKSSGTEKKQSGIGTMNLILIIVGISILVFTVVMIRVFLIYGAIPDTLCTCVFGMCGGECGVMGWIKSTKEKYKDREWKKEDEQQAMGGDTSVDGRDPDER